VINVCEAFLQKADFILEVLNFLLVGVLVVVRLADLGKQIRTSTLELIMTELPEPGLLADLSILDTERVALDLAKTVKVELSDKRTKVVVLEKLVNDKPNGGGC
jgi:hypothetical protein